MNSQVVILFGMKGRTGLKSMENGVECEKNGEIDNGRERDLVQKKDANFREKTPVLNFVSFHFILLKIKNEMIKNETTNFTTYTTFIQALWKVY